MTKKLQPTRSLRSLLFGGPHLEFTITLPMEECIRRLQHLEKVGRLGANALNSLEINDLGRTVRWSFATESTTETGSIERIPVKGSFALRGEQQVQVRAVVGSGVRTIAYWILFNGSLFMAMAFPVLGITVLNRLDFSTLEWPWATLPALAMILIVTVWVLINILILPAILRRIPQRTDPTHIETIAFYVQNGLVNAPSTHDSELAEPQPS